MQRILLSAAAVALAFALVGCDGDVTQNSGPGPTTRPATQPQDPAVAIIKARCFVCHQDNRIDTRHFDRAGWERTVGEMVSKGAQVTAAERAAIVDYLTKRDVGKPRTE